MTLAGTTVLLDPVTDDQDWAEWSIEKLADTALKGPVRGNGRSGPRRAPAAARKGIAKNGVSMPPSSSRRGNEAVLGGTP